MCMGGLGWNSRELGPLNLKDIARPVEAFVLRSVVASPGPVARSFALGETGFPPLPDKPSIAVLALHLT